MGRKGKATTNGSADGFFGIFSEEGLNLHSNAREANFRVCKPSFTMVVEKQRNFFGLKWKLREFRGLERGVRAAGDRSAGNKPSSAGRTPDQRPDWECTRTARPSKRHRGAAAIEAEKCQSSSKSQIYHCTISGFQLC